MKILAIFMIITVLCNFTACDKAEKKESSEDIIPKTKQHDEIVPTWVEKIKYGTADSFNWTTPVIEDERYVYYVSQDGIYKYDKLSQDEEIIVSDSAIRLRREGDKIYYFTTTAIKSIDANDNVESVWDISMYPKENVEYMTDMICDFWFYDGELYVMDSYISAIKVDLESGEVENFIRDFSSLAFISDCCYFIDHAERTFTIFEMNLDTKETTILRGDGLISDKTKDQVRYDQVLAIGDTLYFKKRLPDTLCRYEDIQTDTTVVGPASFTLNGFSTSECFYYELATDEGYFLYEYNTVTDTQQILVSNTRPFYDLLITEYSILYRSDPDSPLLLVEY